MFWNRVVDRNCLVCRIWFTGRQLMIIDVLYVTCPMSMSILFNVRNILTPLHTVTCDAALAVASPLRRFYYIFLSGMTHIMTGLCSWIVQATFLATVPFSQTGPERCKTGTNPGLWSQCCSHISTAGSKTLMRDDIMSVLVFSGIHFTVESIVVWRFYRKHVHFSVCLFPAVQSERIMWAADYKQPHNHDCRDWDEG